MKVLALETSERIGSLTALVADQQTLTIAGAKELSRDLRAAQTLIPAIETLLDELNWKPEELELIGVATGPGSFTGTRLGVTTAKTLAYGTGAQVVGVHTLATIAAGVTAEYERLWTILDAQRGELFVSQFQSGQDVPPYQPPETRILKVEEWLNQLQPGDTVSGPPLRKLSDRLPEGVVIADEHQWKPRAEYVGRLGVEAWRAGNTIDAMQLVPNYYRKSAAEEKADARG